MGLTLSLAPSHFLKVLGRLSEDFVQHSFLASRDRVRADFRRTLEWQSESRKVRLRECARGRRQVHMRGFEEWGTWPCRL